MSYENPKLQAALARGKATREAIEYGVRIRREEELREDLHALTHYDWIYTLIERQISHLDTSCLDLSPMDAPVKEIDRLQRAINAIPGLKAERRWRDNGPDYLSVSWREETLCPR